MKIAILCSGLGAVSRGYERFADELNMHLRRHVEVVAFGARGDRARSPVVPVRRPSRDGVLSRVAFVSTQQYRDPYYWEAMAFSAAVLPRLVAGRFDVIHAIDPPIVNFLHRSGRLFHRSSRTVFTNGVGMHDISCTRVDHLHQVSPVTYDEAKKYMPKSRMTFLPYPVDSFPLLVGPQKAQARRDLAIPQERFVVLSVAAINRGHKRIDHLLREVRAVPHVVLVVVGRVEDRSLLSEARMMLGDRFIHRELPFSHMANAYAASDLFALTSLEEGFAMSVVEAMISSRPILVHRNEHFEWLVGDDLGLVDMSEPGALSTAIRSSMQDPPPPAGLIGTRRARSLRRFSWDALLPSYVEMYERVLAGPPRHSRESDIVIDGSVPAHIQGTTVSPINRSD